MFVDMSVKCFAIVGCANRIVPICEHDYGELRQDEQIEERLSDYGNGIKFYELYDHANDEVIAFRI